MPSLTGEPADGYWGYVLMVRENLHMRWRMPDNSMTYTDLRAAVIDLEYFRNNEDGKEYCLFEFKAI